MEISRFVGRSAVYFSRIERWPAGGFQKILMRHRHTLPARSYISNFMALIDPNEQKTRRG
jgi:hypothetical protein